MTAEHWRWAGLYLLTPLAMIAVIRGYLYFKSGANEPVSKGESVAFLIGSLAVLLLLWPLIVPAILVNEKFKIADRLAAWSESPLLCKRKHLTARVAIQYAEASGKVTDPMQRVPDQPFGHLNITWLTFLAKKKFGYKLHSFAIPLREENKALIALRGYAWVRLGTVKAEFFYEWGS